jgi:antitoxin component YwqK of YwqJK toxin-antitoxin module
MKKFLITACFVCLTIFIATGCSSSCDFSQEDAVCESYVHRYGVPVTANDWQARGKNGQVITTLNNGVVVTKNYLGGVLDGDATYTFPHKKTIQKIETYSQGDLLQEVENYMCGTPKQKIEYPSPSKQVALTWYETGIPHIKEEYENGFLIAGEYYNTVHQMESAVDNTNGIRTRRDGCGILISIDTIQDGMMTSRTTYHPNGTPKAITPYLDGQVHGRRKTFLAGGEPETDEEWVNGVLDGEAVVYENGEAYAHVPYSHGVRQGIEQRFRDNKDVVEEVTWVNDQKHGPSRTFVEGNVKTDWFFKDEPVTKIQYDVLTKRK